MSRSLNLTRLLAIGLADQHLHTVHARRFICEVIRDVRKLQALEDELKLKRALEVLERGYRMITIGADVPMLAGALRQALEPTGDG